ncbi:MAG: hypothetical protein JWQ35_704 [Bacteriovoracaceae bacterium]|nr:hypothetical protein [Bacteriovoracaceae bacterium]
MKLYFKKILRASLGMFSLALSGSLGANLDSHFVFLPAKAGLHVKKAIIILCGQPVQKSFKV